MKRLLGSLIVALFALAPVVRADATAASEDMARTAAFLAAFQNPDGGFAGKSGGASSLGSTSSAIRALKYSGGSIPDVLGCIKYVKSCFNADEGGFAPTPGGKPDVNTTASGLMAVSELKIATDEMISKATAFFSKNAKSFEEVRIAAAGMEAVNKPSPDFPAWIAQIEGMRNPDGTFGKGASQAFDTGGSVALLLRMGVKLDKEKQDAALTAMRAGQRPDGGWSRGEGPSTPDATYRIMRAFFMLKEKPDLDKVRSFVARFRQADGGYATQPGGMADVGGTYFASIVLRWARELEGSPALVETAGFFPLFNGKDLTGWEGNTMLWSARDGLLVGQSPGIKQNNFLATEKSYGDFILKLTFRLVNGSGNSGVQFRSVRLPGHEMSGYQADIGNGYWGSLYDESRRNRTLKAGSERALEALHKTDWNEYVVRAMGPKIRLSLNGVLSVDYDEADKEIARSGKIAVQIHSGGPMEVQFKDVLIQPLPTPDEPTSEADFTRPGFHLRTLKTDKGERKYTVFVPNGYDGQKAFPVALFLHGAGERGEDGVTPAQVGLGSAIFAHPDDYPMIAVFPQARQSWRPESDDIQAALAALDEVQATYKTDRNRVILTGLSMGGSGSWRLAALHPERFAAVVPICGRGETGEVEKLKALPVWFVVGDADSAQTVLNGRALVEALRAAGNQAGLTEYRGVGHNSWDRAYNNPRLVDWMLAQSRREGK
jgi:poly(3-hydroxybutyrate) depolymerase/prenyltransferase beta subunit